MNNRWIIEAFRDSGRWILPQSAGYLVSSWIRKKKKMRLSFSQSTFRWFIRIEDNEENILPWFWRMDQKRSPAILTGKDPRWFHRFKLVSSSIENYLRANRLIERRPAAIPDTIPDLKRSQTPEIRKRKVLRKRNNTWSIKEGFSPHHQRVRTFLTLHEFNLNLDDRSRIKRFRVRSKSEKDVRQFIHDKTRSSVRYARESWWHEAVDDAVRIFGSQFYKPILTSSIFFAKIGSNPTVGFDHWFFGFLLILFMFSILPYSNWPTAQPFSIIIIIIIINRMVEIFLMFHRLLNKIVFSADFKE